MREIEIKIKLDEIDSIKQYFLNQGINLPKETIQEDEVFVNEEFEKNRGCVRIRTENSNNFKFTYKRSLTKENQLDSIEKETEVKDGNILKEILLLSGFKIYSKVLKKRIKFNFKNYEICIDDVKDLGYFLEVEKLITENDSSKNIEEEILDFIINDLKIKALD